jgi:hypothetical protein
MIETLRLPNRGPVVLILAACVASGVALTFWPSLALLVLLGAVLLAALSATGRAFFAFFLLFLVFQDPLRFLIANDDSPAGLLIKWLDEAMLYVLGTVAILFQVRVHRVLQETRVAVTLVVIYAGLILSSLVAQTTLWPSVMDLALFSKPFLLFVLGVAAAPSDLEVKRFTPAIVLGMTLVVLFAIVFLAFPGLQETYIGSFRGTDERVGLISAQGFFDGAGGYSWFCAASFALAYAAYLCYERPVFLFAAIIDACFVLLSWRRKSIVGVLIMLLVAVLVRSGPGRASRARTLLIVGLAIISAVVLLTPYFAALWDYTVAEYGGSDPYANARKALHYGSLLIARDHFPLGTGLASFGSHASRVYYSEVYKTYGLSSVPGLEPQFSEYITDTFWPMVLGEGGVVSFAAYVFFLMILLKGGWTLARRAANTTEARLIALSALFLLVGSISESTSSPIYNTTMQSALVMVPLGVMWERRTRGGS